MTLVTCTPLGLNTHRILVTGERMTPTPTADLDAAGARPLVPGFPWWIVVLAAGVGAVSVWYLAFGEDGSRAVGGAHRVETLRSSRPAPGLPALGS